MTLEEQYTYALEVISMAYEHLQGATPDIDLTNIQEVARKLQDEVSFVKTLSACDNVRSEEEVNQPNKERSLEGM